MIKLSCVIVDDEPVAQKVLREFIGQVSFLELVGELENALKAEAFVSKNQVDLLFLDIEMPRLSGLDYLRSRSNDHHPMVIIATAHPKYAIEGYTLDVVDYLLKPIAFGRFVKAVQKAKSYKELTKQAAGVGSPSFLFVKGSQRIEKVELAEILFIESIGNYVKIVMESKEIVAYLTLKGMEEQLPAADFVKIHQSFLVNFRRVESVEGNLIGVKNHSLPVSRGYRQDFINRIDERMLKR
jgi:DNA-binding LytR/AlgR family response regulator